MYVLAHFCSSQHSFWYTVGTKLIYVVLMSELICRTFWKESWDMVRGRKY